MSQPPESDSPDRRRATRHVACFAAQVEHPERKKSEIAMIHDLSSTGCLLLTRKPYAVGNAVQLAMYTTSADEVARTVSGRVVRVVRREFDRSDLWRHSAAVQFDEPITDFEADIEAVAAARAKRGLSVE